MGGLHRQGTVHIHLKALMAKDPVLLLDLLDKIQKFLSAPHGKSRNHHIAAPVQGSLDNAGQLVNMAHDRVMLPVPVSTLHDHIIRLLDVVRIPGQRLTRVADIPGEHDLLHHVPLMAPHLDRSRPQKMARVRKPDGNVVVQLYHLPVVKGRQMA